MSDIQFLDPEALQSKEDYMFMLVTSAISLATISRVQLIAIQRGILDDDEIERAQSIGWEIKRLGQLLQSQLEDCERSVPLKITDIMEIMKKRSVEAAQLLIDKSKDQPKKRGRKKKSEGSNI